uniref:Rx N-terminal domain-containing protein n=1 Tax=Oryza punctata TaxID=4537 RepID=A0A0E0KM29_ORYPU
MAETVSSAIVGEAVSIIFSRVIRKNEGSSEEGDNIERLEMAHIKIEAAVETSIKWQITNTSLLRWQKKLKRASQECDDMLHRCKQRALEDKEIKGQLGGRSLQYLFFDPLIAHLFASKSLRYQILHDGSQYHFFSIRPMSFEERGLEAMLFFVYEDCKVPKNSFRLGFILRLSESTDIMGITVKCLQLVTPHFKSTVEIVIRELTQLPTQDFSWLPPYNEYGSMEHWDNVQTTLTQWFRPDPLCCSEGYIPACSSSSINTTTSSLSSIFPEPVIQLWFLFMPHDSVEDLEPANTAERYAVEAIDGEKQQNGHVNVHPHQLDEMLLPKAIDYLYHNAEATTYQMYWKSKHSSAHLSVEKTSMVTPPRSRRTTR